MGGGSRGGGIRRAYSARFRPDFVRRVRPARGERRPKKRPRGARHSSRHTHIVLFHVSSFLFLQSTTGWLLYGAFIEGYYSPSTSSGVPGFLEEKKFRFINFLLRSGKIIGKLSSVLLLLLVFGAFSCLIICWRFRNRLVFATDIIVQVFFALQGGGGGKIPTRSVGELAVCLHFMNGIFKITTC